MKLEIVCQRIAALAKRATHPSKMMGTAVLSLSLLGLTSAAFGQFSSNPFGTRIGVVGGVKVDAQGVAQHATLAENQAYMQSLREQFRGAPQNLKQPADRRLISLKGLQATIAEHAAAGRALPEEVMFLGGLTRIEYVFLFPNQQDIVIGGPAEGWTVGTNGSIVGEKSGRPVVYLDDLISAFRTVEAARVEGISCSIEPTADGTKRYTQMISQLPANQDPHLYEGKLQEAMGPQQVLIKGAIADSHMARVILAADYQMKRYGMNLTEAPVKNLPSYIEMINGKASRISQSRWWMTTDYNALERSEDSMAWHITGRGIKTMTEAEMVDTQGVRTQSGKTDPIAQKWADNFTSKMDELTVRDPIFGELRNIMDVCVLAALVESQGLADAAHCDLAVLTGSKPVIGLAKLATPVSLPAQCSFLKTSGGWIVTASGGVQVNSWAVASKSKVNDRLTAVRASAPTPAPSSWIWN